jgi:hypothetical protein
MRGVTKSINLKCVFPSARRAAHSIHMMYYAGSAPPACSVGGLSRNCTMITLQLILLGSARAHKQPRGSRGSLHMLPLCLVFSPFLAHMHVCVGGEGWRANKLKDFLELTLSIPKRLSFGEAREERRALNYGIIHKQQQTKTLCSKSGGGGEKGAILIASANALAASRSWSNKGEGKEYEIG